MFKKLTKFVVSQMDPRKEIVPVESLADNEHFRPLCLLKQKRKSKRIFHSAPYYQRTGFTLDNVLLPGEDGQSIESIHQGASQFTLTKARADEVDGHACLPLSLVSVELKGAVSLSKDLSIKLQKNSISLESLEALRKERKINMDHSFIQQQRTDNLYVVTEILEASQETSYKESTKADGGFKAKFYAISSAKGARENNQGIVIPKGCTLAFRTIQLRIRDGAWDLDYEPGEDMNKFINQGGRDLQGKIDEVEREFKNHCQILCKLSSDQQLIILNTIKAVMRDRELFQELSQKMEEVLEQKDFYHLKTESPDLKDLFSTLQNSPRDCLLELAEGITYILDALHELTEDQLLLLLESLERNIVSKQRDLVEILLGYDLDLMGQFHVDAELLSFPHKEEQRLTMELVELSGVQLQEDGSALPRNQPFEAVAALFVALCALKFLSGSK